MIALTVSLVILGFIVYLVYILFWQPLQRNKWYVQRYGKRCKSIYYPLLGNVKFVRESFRKYGDSLKWIRDLLRDDDEVEFLIGYSNIHIVDANLAKDLLLNSMQIIEKPYSMEFQNMFFQKGILFAEGESWKKQRNMMSHSFSYDVLKSRIPKINEIVKRMIEKIDTNEGKQPVHISDECSKITAEIVLKTFFGDKFSEQLYEGQNLGLYLIHLLLLAFNETRRLRNILPKLFLPKAVHFVFRDRQYKEAEKKCRSFHQFIEKEVDDRIKNYIKENENQEFLDILVGKHIASCERNNGVPESHVSRESLTDQFLSFFFAGMDTTGYVASSMIYWIAKREDILAKITSEIDNVIEDDQITDEALKQLNYCHMFILETLRYHSPAMFLIPRKAKKDFLIGKDIQVRKGMDINISLHGLLRRPKYFENPDEFNPDRFSEENKRNINHLAFIPFSSGPKNCIGQHMAQIELKIILIRFIRSFSIKINEEVPLKMDSNTLYSPADDRLVFLERKQK